MNRFLKLVQQKEFFKEHRRVLVALSGGKDSMTLFNWLYTYRKELEVELFTAHVNYGLRDVADWEEEQLKQKWRISRLNWKLLITILMRNSVKKQEETCVMSFSSSYGR